MTHDDHPDAKSPGHLSRDATPPELRPNASDTAEGVADVGVVIVAAGAGILYMTLGKSRGRQRKRTSFAAREPDDLSFGEAPAAKKTTPAVSAKPKPQSRPKA